MSTPHQLLTLDRADVAGFGAQQLGATADRVRLRVVPLRGGLESASVGRWVAQRDDTARRNTLTFVVKRLEGRQRREGAIYTQVLPTLGEIAPALLRLEQTDTDTAHLYLEHVRADRAWPWRDTYLAGRVLETVAGVHSRLAVESLAEVEPAWDYEAELLASAATTYEVFDQVVSMPDLAWLRPGSGWLRRACDALPAMRRALLASEPFGASVIHGDVHTGNLALVSGKSGRRVVLFDWARLRVGSPLEDVASWLQSLGYWEPEAKRRHDTLLRLYIVARGQPSAISRPVRDAYWLAAASNVLAGALRYHLGVAAGWSSASSAGREQAARAARDGLRVLRRADHVWRG